MIYQLRVSGTSLGFSQPRNICRDDAADAAAAAKASQDAADAAAAKAEAAAGAGAEAFTPAQQEKVNALLATEKRAAQVKIQEQLATLEALQRDGLTPEGKEALETQITALRDQTTSEVEQVKQTLSKQQKTWELEKKSLTTQRDEAIAKHDTLQVDTLLTTAMGLHSVRASAMSIVKPYLMERMKTVPVLDDAGKATGEISRIIQIDVADAEDATKVKTLQLAPDKAVAHLKEQAEFAGLFSSAAASGTGSGHVTKTGEPDFSRMTQAEYMEYRKTQKKEK